MLIRATCDSETDYRFPSRERNHNRGCRVLCIRPERSIYSEEGVRLWEGGKWIERVEATFV